METLNPQEMLSFFEGNAERRGRPHHYVGPHTLVEYDGFDDMWQRKFTYSWLTRKRQIIVECTFNISLKGLKAAFRQFKVFFTQVNRERPRSLVNKFFGTFYLHERSGRPYYHAAHVLSEKVILDTNALGSRLKTLTHIVEEEVTLAEALLCRLAEGRDIPREMILTALFSDGIC